MDSHDKSADEKAKKHSESTKNEPSDSAESDNLTASRIAAIESRAADDEASEPRVVELPSPEPEPKSDPEPSPVLVPVTSQTPESQPAVTVPPVSHSSPGQIILQWLTYAFWGWTLLSVMVLVSLVVGSFFDNYDASAVLPYSIAATLVLLPLSLVCDLFYGRNEPTRKSGGATVVMVIHAVIFALFGIGLLISVVFILVNQGIDGFSSFDNVRTALITLSVSVILYAMTFLRTLNPIANVPVARIYRIVMLLVVGTFIVLAFVGPAARSAVTRDDREIVANIDGVNDAVSAYVNTNHKLPASLKDVKLDERAKTLVDKGLIKYKSDGKATAIDSYQSEDTRYVSDEYRYQLCVTYKEASQGYHDSYSTIVNLGDSYEEYPHVSDHPAGEVCYKLKTTVYEDSSSTEKISVDTIKT